jgi:ABC-type multidrug transport system ATPase subunit
VSVGGPNTSTTRATGAFKSFGAAVINAGDLTKPEGTVLALLSPNGAGETTSVQMPPTLIPADSGHLQIRRPGQPPPTVDLPR